MSRFSTHSQLNLKSPDLKAQCHQGRSDNSCFQPWRLYFWMRQNNNVKTAACDGGPAPVHECVRAQAKCLNFDFSDFSYCIFKNLPFWQAVLDNPQARHHSFTHFFLAQWSLQSVRPCWNKTGFQCLCRFSIIQVIFIYRELNLGQIDLAVDIKNHSRRSRLSSQRLQFKQLWMRLELKPLEWTTDLFTTKFSRVRVNSVWKNWVSLKKKTTQMVPVLMTLNRFSLRERKKTNLKLPDNGNPGSWTE